MSSGGYSFDYTSQLAPPWTSLVPVVLGEGEPKGLFILVEKCGEPNLVFALSKSDHAECWFRQEVISWNALLVIGFAERVYLVRLDGTIDASIVLDDYFSGFTCGQDWLLVATATQILRLDPNGEVVWKSESLANDGVVIKQVVDGCVWGEGEINPPDGWQPFVLGLTNGIRQQFEQE